LCTTDYCDPYYGCMHEPIICDRGNGTIVQCDPEEGCIFGCDEWVEVIIRIPLSDLGLGPELTCPDDDDDAWNEVIVKIAMEDLGLPSCTTYEIEDIRYVMELP